MKIAICMINVEGGCENPDGCRHAKLHEMGIDCMIDCGSDTEGCNCVESCVDPKRPEGGFGK